MVISKRNFLKKMSSLCLLPFVPVSFLLSRRKEVQSRVAMNSAIRAFLRSPASQGINGMLNARKLPLAFIPGDIRKRYMNGELTTDDEMVIARIMNANFKCAMDWVTKVLGKQVPVKIKIPYRFDDIC